MTKVRVAINGAAGRMGRRLVALGEADDALEVVCGRDVTPGVALSEGLTTTQELVGEPQVVIDFTVAAATRELVPRCAGRGIALVIGTTGLTADDQKLLDEAARRVAVLQASNFSLVVNVLYDLAARAAKLLGPEYDCEILEAHHRFKKDAPSGTAITLGRHIADARGVDFNEVARFERHGDEVERQPGEITLQTLRIGDHPGEHTAYFATLGERLELKHVSTSRDSYAVGALRAAKWLADKPAGRYAMKDVLGLSH